MRRLFVFAAVIALDASAGPKPTKLAPAVEAGLKALVADVASETYSARAKGSSFKLTFRQKLERPTSCNLSVLIASEAWTWEVVVPLGAVSLGQLKPTQSVPAEIVGNLDWSAGSPWCTLLVFEDKVTAQRWLTSTSRKDAEPYGLFYTHVCFADEAMATKASDTLTAAAKACGAH